jgi:NitT/TauT family transport system substrate-binding protein
MTIQPLLTALPGSPRLHGLRRRSAMGLMVGAVACGAALEVLAQSKPEKTRVLIAVGNKSGFCNLPLALAEQLGFFAAEGLDVDIMAFADSAQALQAVASGAADVGAGAYLHTLQMQGKNQNFQAFVLQARAPQIAMGVSVHTLPDYKYPTDLSGKKFGISRPGSLANLVAHAFLMREAMAPSSVSFVPTGTAAVALVGVRSGQLDVICQSEPVITLLEQKGDVRILADTRTLKGTQGVFGGVMPGNCLQAPADFLRRNPNTVQAITHAMVRSLKWLQTAGPSDLIKAVPEPHLLGDRGLYLAAFNKLRESYSVDGAMPEDGSRVAWRAAAGFDPKLVANRIVLSRTYTNEFVSRAKERFKV